MLDLRQFLLTKLSEECAEVAQRACKQIQFGTYQTQEKDYEFFEGPHSPITEDGKKPNRERLLDEVCDLIAVMKMLETIDELPDMMAVDFESRFSAKVKKLRKYLTLSIHHGTVDPTVLEQFDQEFRPVIAEQ